MKNVVNKLFKNKHLITQIRLK